MSTPADPGPAARWLRAATSRSVVRRALQYAVVVGAILIAINHGDAILRGEVDLARAGKMVLTVMVPYLVSTLSSVGAMMERSRSAPEGRREETK